MLYKAPYRSGLDCCSCFGGHQQNKQVCARNSQVSMVWLLWPRHRAWHVAIVRIWRGQQWRGAGLGMVAHTYNPCYWGSREQPVIPATWESENCGSRPAQAKSYWDLISTSKLRVVAPACHLRYTVSTSRNIAVQISSREKHEILLEKQLEQNGWRYDSNGRALA
jgi:hypothetical protein